MAGRAGQGEPLQADAISRRNSEIARIALHAVLEMLQGELMALRSPQGLARLDPGIGAKGGDGRSLARTSRSPMRPVLRASSMRCLPGIVLLPELRAHRRFGEISSRLLEIGHQVVHRTRLSAVPRIHRRRDHLGQLALVLFQVRGVRSTIAEAGSAAYGQCRGRRRSSPFHHRRSRRPGRARHDGHRARTRHWIVDVRSATTKSATSNS